MPVLKCRATTKNVQSLADLKCCCMTDWGSRVHIYSTEGDGTMHINVKYCIKCEQLTKFILKKNNNSTLDCFLLCNRLCTAETGNVTAKQQAPPTPTLSQNNLIYQQSLHFSLLASCQESTMVTVGRNPLKVCGYFVAKSMYMLSYTHTQRDTSSHQIDVGCTSISCTCSSLVMYICCSESSSSLLRSRRVFPSSAAKCRSDSEQTKRDNTREP